MGRLLDDTYKSKKDEIKQELSDALTKIHLGFDLWTSPNRHAVMAVTAHFLDRQGKHQSRLLALRRQLGCHSGESLAVMLGQVVREWKIEDRVGTVISDNASSNDSCLMNFYGDLDAEMSLADIQARRMRCYRHILNLVARAFLYGEDFEAFEAESSSPQRCELFKRISRENDEAQEYLLASESTAELEVVMNNDTRWNSTYLMISRALVKQGDIRAFLVHPEVEKWLPEADMLKGDDWRLLAEIKLILEPFYLQTMRTRGWGSEGGNRRLWEVMTGMEYLLEHLEDRKLFHHAVPDEAGGQDTNSQAELAQGRPDRNRQLPARFRDCETDIHPRKSRQGPLSDRGSRQCDDRSGKPSGSLGINDMGKDHRHYLRLSIMTAWQKLNEYYTKLRDSPLFAASIILHPSLGMNYLEVN
ncbi:hypothetical protein FOMA001_g17921 [Fusarium oxysporum f. sp. matthiolae]|nr:hypothetical protein FOMA001_g17921 [Fusarium oxysporum f. sp. matthiolae]